jgi:hypothetical protein
MIFTDFVFGDNISPDMYQMIWAQIDQGTVPPEVIQQMFHKTWGFDPAFSTQDAYTMKNSSNPEYCFSFGYRIIDLDQESIRLDVPMYLDNWDERNTTLSDTNYLAIRLLNFTHDERVKFMSARVFVQTGDSGWTGAIGMYKGIMNPEQKVTDIPVVLNASTSDWIILDFDGQQLQEDFFNYWIIINGSENGQELRIIHSDLVNSPFLVSNSTNGVDWDTDQTGCSPTMIITANKFSSSQYGDGLSNRDEYIIGTHPKKNNTDKIIIDEEVHNDYLDDNEVYGDGTSASHTIGGVIFRTSFDNGSRSFGAYLDS